MNIFVLDADPKLAAQALCKLCDKKCKNTKSLAAHLRFKHRDWTKKQYYDENYKRKRKIEPIIKKKGVIYDHINIILSS